MTVLQLLETLKAQKVELWFEGERLRFRAPRGVFSEAQRSELLQHRAEVLARLRADAEAAETVLPASFSQRSLWFVHQQAPQSAAYHVAMPIEIRSTLDVEALRQALQVLVDRHAALRTTYDLFDGVLSQRVAGARRADLEHKLISGATDEALSAMVDADYRRPFDLLNGPIFRFVLYTRSATDHVLLLVAHHIAVDGWSVVLLIEELLKVYDELTGGPPAELPRQDLQYTDYARWQAEMLAGPEGERMWNYWRGKLAAPRQRIDLPGDRPRPPVTDLCGSIAAVQARCRRCRDV